MSAGVAAFGEAQEPTPECRVETGPNRKWRVWAQKSLQRSPNGSGGCQGKNVAWTNIAAIAVRAAVAELSLIDERDIRQISRTR